MLPQAERSYRFARVEWPAEISWDYGDVAAADFDGDAVTDLAFAIHFKATWLVHGVKGSGGLKYDRAARLPLAGGGKVSSRAFALGDFNRDGRPDIAVLAELDLDMATNVNLNNGLISVLLNEAGGWRAVDLGAQRVYGDHIAVADFDGDGWDDVLVAKNTNHDTPFLFFNRDKGERWQGADVSGLPWMPYVFGVAALGDGAGPAKAALVAMQSVRWEGVQRQINFVTVAGVEPDGRLAQPVELARFESQVYLSAAAAGDLDGDGRSDLVVGDIRGGVRIFLNRPDGWLEERSPELRLPRARISYLEVQTGVNSRTPLDSAWGYCPPRTEIMAQDEIMIPAKLYDHSVQVFFDHPPGLIFGALIPKGRYANISLLGRRLQPGAVGDFLDGNGISALFPDGLHRLCGCAPRVAVTAAGGYFPDRMVAVGDAAVTRLYKNGMGMAFITARAAAQTAIQRGVSRLDFARGNAPVCRAIAVDNFYGGLLFFLWETTRRIPFLLRAWEKTVAAETRPPVPKASTYSRLVGDV